MYRTDAESLNTCVGHIFLFRSPGYWGNISYESLTLYVSLCLRATSLVVFTFDAGQIFSWEQPSTTEHCRELKRFATFAANEEFIILQTQRIVKMNTNQKKDVSFIIHHFKTSRPSIKQCNNYVNFNQLRLSAVVHQHVVPEIKCRRCFPFV